MKKEKIKETDLAKRVIEWLKEKGWTEIHQEVSFGMGSRRADIVAVRGKYTWVVETKTNISLSLMDQAYDWLLWSHYVSVATPYDSSRGRSNHHPFLLTAMKHFKIGLIQVADLGTSYEHIYNRIKPGLNKNILPRLKNRLNKGTQTFALAGNSDHQYWTPFRETCRLIKEAVAKWPGMNTKTLVRRINHHYASEQSAYGALLQWAHKGTIQGVELRGTRPVTWWSSKKEKK